MLLGHACAACYLAGLVSTAMRIELLDGKDSEEQEQTRLRVDNGKFHETL